MGGVPGLARPARSPAAKTRTFAPTARPSTSPAAKFACFAPGQGSAASCASSAASISAVLAGKNALSTAAEAPPMAADVGRWGLMPFAAWAARYWARPR